MAVRQVTLDLRALGAFLEAWTGSLTQAAVVIPAGTVQGELAPEFKLDLLLPLIGRVGPIGCQIIQRMPDGSTAARIPEMPSKVEKSAQQVLDFVQEVREHLGRAGEAGGGPVPAASSPPGGAEEGRPAVGSGTEGGGAEAAAVDTGAPEAGAPEVGTPDGAEPGAESPEAGAPEVGAPEAAASGVAGPGDQALPPPPEGPVDQLIDEVSGPVERGLKVPDLGGRAPTLSGLLGDRSLRAALLRLGAEAATGLLTITTLDDGVRWGFWSQGGPVGWCSEPMQRDETLGALLRQAGHPGPEVLAQADVLMERKGLRLGEALLAMGVITEDMREVLLQRQAEHVLKRVLALREGAWSFHPLELLPDRFDCAPVSVPTFVYRAVLGHALTLPPASVFAALKARGRMFASIRAEQQPLLDAVAWSRPEADLLAAMRRKPERLESLVQGQGPGDLRLAATLLAMGELGVLEFTKLPGTRLSTLGDLEERVRVRGPRAAADNHFDRMELHWICVQEEVDERFRRLVQEYDLSVFPAVSPELKTEVEGLMAAIKEAYGVLKDAEARRAYRAEVIDPEVSAGAVELLAARARAAAQGGDLGAAQGLWARALELSPANAEFKQALADCAVRKR